MIHFNKNSLSVWAASVFILATASCLGAGTGVDYVTTVQPIFTNKCATSGCHTPTGNAPFDLTAANSYSKIINKTSSKIFAPNTYTYHIRPNATALSDVQWCICVAQTSSNSKFGGAMGSWTTVQSDYDALNNWINQGALPNLNSPTVTAVSPTSGPAAGGTSITVTGTLFGGVGAFVPTVTIGGVACTNVVVANLANNVTPANGTAMTITCVTPAGTAGGQPVVVTTTAGGASAALANAFTFTVATPTISAIAASSGPSGGGQNVTLTGANFLAGATVTFGGAAATAVNVVSTTQITCTTPAHAAGAVNVVVTTTAGGGTSTNGYTYLDAPTVTAAAPAAGPLGGATSVTLTGTNFVAGATVNFGGTAATGVNVASATQLTCTAPAHAAGAVNVDVATNGGTGTLTNGYTYVGAPTIASVAPSSGPAAGGTSVTINGANFFAGATVTMGGTAATAVNVVNATQLTCTAPAHAAGAADVVVTSTGGSVTSTGGYTYLTSPTISSIAPTAGPLAGGTNVSLTGATFLAGSTVTIGGAAATSVNVVSTTQITCTTPPHAAGAVDVVVTNSAGTGTLASGFTYVGAPTISSLTPTGGPAAGGQSVTINGTNFAPGTSATFGGVAATNGSLISSTQWSGTVPAHAAGAVDVVLTTVGGNVTSAGAYTYYNAPTVSGVAPGTGLDTGGTAVVVTGTNFIAGASVSVGGLPATSVVVNSATQIACVTPAHAAGAVDVVVNTLGGTGTLPNGFTYASAPTIAGIAPNAGPAAGGQSVTINGTSFLAGSTVTIGGAAATGVTVVSATQITCLTPAHAAGAADVVVTTTVGNATSAGGYTYYAAPTVTGVNPTSGPAGGGISVVVTGTGFMAGATVSFGGTAATAVTVDSGTQITCTLPAHAAGAVSVSVDTAGGSGSLAAAFTYTNIPTLASVSPSSGPDAGGQSVTVTGTDFVSGASLTFGGAAATNVVVVSATQITCSTPPHAAGSVDVAISTANGPATLAGGYSFVAAPTVTSVTPNSGLPAGGTSVTIAGTGFAAGASVMFGGVAATGITATSATQITCSTPAHAAGAVDVVVTTVGGSGTLANGFQYASAPQITSANTTTFIVGTPGTFTVTTTGSQPMTVSETGLSLSGITFTDNGSGTATLSGTAGAGTAGSYTLTITAANAGGSVQQTFTLLIITPNPVIGSGIDSDGDGFSDSFETAAGSLPLDASSTPLGGAHAPTPISLTLSKPSIALNFSKGLSDSIKFAGTINVPAGFSVSGKKVIVDVGGVVQPFTLDTKGSAKAGSSSIKLPVKAKKGVVAAQVSKFSVALSKGNYAASLADKGLANANVAGAPVTVVFNVLFDGNILRAQANLTYKAKMGKTGAAK